MKTNWLLKIDTLFVWPYLLGKFFLSKRSVKEKNRNAVLVIKLLGQGSIIRLVSFYRSKNIDTKSFTLITFDRNREICQYLQLEKVQYVSSLSIIRFIVSLFRITQFAWRLKPRCIIDLERASYSVSCFRFLLSFMGGCKSLGFDLNPLVIKGCVHTLSAEGRTIQQLFGETLFLFEKSYFPKSIPHPKKEIDFCKVIVNINASDYVLGRRYPRDSFKELLVQLSRLNLSFSFYLTGSSTEHEYVQELVDDLKSKISNIHNSAGAWNWARFANELDSCAIFITGDSGPMHLAASKRIPTVAIWGPTQAGQFGYDYDEFCNVSLSLPCSPCFNHPKSKAHQACNHHITCMKNLPPSQIAATVMRVIEKERARANSFLKVNSVNADNP